MGNRVDVERLGVKYVRIEDRHVGQAPNLTTRDSPADPELPATPVPTPFDPAPPATTGTGSVPPAYPTTATPPFPPPLPPAFPPPLWVVPAAPPATVIVRVGANDRAIHTPQPPPPPPPPTPLPELPPPDPPPGPTARAVPLAVRALMASLKRRHPPLVAPSSVAVP